MTRKSPHLFSGQFVQADANGNAIRHELPYTLQIQTHSLMLADCRIAMNQVLQAEPHGCGVVVVYRNSSGQPVRLMLASACLFHFARRLQMAAMIRAIHLAQRICKATGEVSPAKNEA